MLISWNKLIKVQCSYRKEEIFSSFPVRRDVTLNALSITSGLTLKMENILISML
jgi:hypothetical protein